jgi:ribosomal protein S18 acetylase RimI-like enzyme
MKDDGCQQVVLETEASNHAALGLYTKVNTLHLSIRSLSLFPLPHHIYQLVMLTSRSWAS